MPIQPRVCGDYYVVMRPWPAAIDTTPRVRGLLQAEHNLIPMSRYNPACAGTTFCPVDTNSQKQIQPRVCGDYNRLYFHFAYLSDTPPRVRGLHFGE